MERLEIDNTNLNSSCVSVYKTLTSPSTGNLAQICDSNGYYFFTMEYSEDTSAYYMAFVYKESGQLPVVYPLTSNKLSRGAINVSGTIVANYNDVATAGIVGTAYKFK